MNTILSSRGGGIAPALSVRTASLTAAAVGGGAMLWLMFWLISPQGAVDNPLFYLVGLPLWVVFAGILGAAGPQTPVRWSFLIAFGQFAATVLTSGISAIFPLTVIFLCLLAVPGVLAAWVGQWIALGDDD